MEQKKKTFKGYEKFKFSKQKACCKGRCITGPGFAGMTILVFNIIGLYLNLIWYIYMAPFYFKHIGYALPIITMILGVHLHYIFLSITF
jgi:hypothetical protein